VQDFGEMFQRQGLDAVVVATPETEHWEQVEMAAKDSCEVLMGKPIAANLEVAKVVIAACDATGVPLMVDYNLRFEPSKLPPTAPLNSAGRSNSRYIDREAALGAA
jgi:1,5-anhydro-D-fructose reductase (1,5-anhydro-D-mannitol-forming)